MIRLAPLLLVLLLVGCRTTAGTATPHPLQQWSGSQSGVDEPSTQVIRDAQGWTALWQQLEREAPPSPNWSTQSAVAVFLGQRPTGGYRAEAVELRNEAGLPVLVYREHRPRPEMRVSQALTTPWVVVLVSHTEGPVLTRRIDPAQAQPPTTGR